ncbi:extracellular solute-binding protein [Natronorubrum aibiense]|uniref:Extracellular solute-binding protein n=2 Tax=Natronorubrum aibiense TaxID=348826 RepID=A0A5P9P7M8_9EURY|nr:extracellular solute-binding protein [Natronorubrum aibiense]
MVTRRTALATIGAGSLAGIAGCLGGESNTLRFLGFGGNTQESQMEVFQRWADDSEYEIEGTSAGGTTEMISMIQQNPGEFDIVALNDTGMAQGQEEGVLAPIDLDEVPNYTDNIRDGAQDLTFLVEDGETVGLIRENGATGYAYNTELVDRELTSWEDIKADEFEGDLALLDRAVDRFSNCAVAIGADINEAADDEGLLEDVIAEAEAQNANCFSYWSDGATSIQYLRQENATVCEAWGGRVLALQEDGYDHIEYVMPEEGAMAWTDTLAIADGTENRETVHELLNFTYDRENLLDLSDMMNYTIQVEDPPEEMTDLPDYAPVEDLAFRDWSKILPLQDDWSERFQEVKQS